MLRDRSGLVFPSALRPGKPLSDMTLTKILRDNSLAEYTTNHGKPEALVCAPLKAAVTEPADPCDP